MEHVAAKTGLRVFTEEMKMIAFRKYDERESLTYRLRNAAVSLLVLHEAANEIERLRGEVDALNEESERIAHHAAEVSGDNKRLRQVCRDAYEVWAGSEGIPEPKYASEAYLLSLLMNMTDEVRKGLK